MIGFKLDTAKTKFFDPKKIADKAERAQLKALSKFGAFVRRRARSSIRKRKKASAPGQPPSSHVGLLKDFLFFFVEREEKNVVIGPIQLNRGDGLTPGRLERGGDALVRESQRRNKERQEKLRQVKILPRPFMRPAFDAEIEKAATLLKNQVK